MGRCWSGYEWRDVTVVATLCRPLATAQNAQVEIDGRRNAPDPDSRVPQAQIGSRAGCFTRCLVSSNAL